MNAIDQRIAELEAEQAELKAKLKIRTQRIASKPSEKWPGFAAFCRPRGINTVLGPYTTGRLVMWRDDCEHLYCPDCSPIGYAHGNKTGMAEELSMRRVNGEFVSTEPDPETIPAGEFKKPKWWRDLYEIQNEIRWRKVREDEMARRKIVDVPDWAAELLNKTTTVYEGRALKITEKLARPDYVQLNKVLQALGGKWDKRQKVHLFKDDAREVIQKALGDGSVTVEQVVNKKQTHSQFFTPRKLAERMVELAEIEHEDMTILEPSAGDGAILDVMFEQGIGDLHFCEIDMDLCEKLERKGYDMDGLIYHDFFECDTWGYFDRIIMNPPFNNGEDIKHILHAVKMLKSGGKLVSLCANGSRQKEKLFPFCWDWQDLPEDSFKESGTRANVALIVIDKEYFDQVNKEAA